MSFGHRCQSYIWLQLHKSQCNAYNLNLILTPAFEDEPWLIVCIVFDTLLCMWCRRKKKKKKQRGRKQKRKRKSLHLVIQEAARGVKRKKEREKCLSQVNHQMRVASVQLMTVMMIHTGNLSQEEANVVVQLLLLKHAQNQDQNAVSFFK